MPTPIAMQVRERLLQALTHERGGTLVYPTVLLRRLAVEVFLVRLRISAGLVDNAIAMVGRRVACEEHHWNRSGIDDGDS